MGYCRRSSCFNRWSGHHGLLQQLSSTPVIVDGCGVPKYYSNQDGACIAPSETSSWVACQTGSVYDEKKQACFSLTIPAPQHQGVELHPNTSQHNTDLPCPKTLGMKDYGGQKLSGAIVHMVYWGEDWLSQTTPWSATSMDNPMKTLLASHFYDSLIQNMESKGQNGAEAP